MSDQIIRVLLNSFEWHQINKEPSGNGGFQNFIRALRERAEPLSDGVLLRFDREQLGQLVFYMIYGWDKGRGGYQGRLRKAFGRALGEKMGIL